MRHRQSSGANPSGVRSSIAKFTLTGVAACAALVVRTNAGLWFATVTACAAAMLGCVSLWRQRGLIERRAEQMAVRRRADLAAAGATQERYRSDLDRLRAELVH